MECNFETEQLMDAQIIDLREECAYKKSYIRGARNIPYEKLNQHTWFPKDKILIFYFERGGASMMAARQMEEKGYRTKSVIGFAAYQGRNLVFFS